MVSTLSAQYTTYDLLTNTEMGVQKAITSIFKNLDIIPSNIDLAAAELEIAGAINRENRLNRHLRELTGNYDYILVDCPPSLGILTINALCAATEVTICIETSYYALHGVKKLARPSIESIMTEYDKVLMVRALPTMYDKRPKLDRDVLQEIHNQFENLTYETVVHRTVKLREAASAGKPISMYDKTSSGYPDYARLAKEILSEETRRKRQRPGLQRGFESLLQDDDSAKVARVIKRLTGKTKASETASELPELRIPASQALDEVPLLRHSAHAKITPAKPTAVKNTVVEISAVTIEANYYKVPNDERYPCEPANPG